MGAVHFSLDTNLIKTIKTILPLDVFVETGTFKGDSIENVKNYFSEIHSVELSEEYFQYCKDRFQTGRAINLYLDNSPVFLKKIQPSISKKSVLYWLDAHWCVADRTAGEKSQCPLLEELKSIKSLNSQSIIIIDDARLFISPPPVPHEISQWPDFESVIQNLKKLSNKHNTMILNDAIVFYPVSIIEIMRNYAHNNSIDWLTVLDKSRDYEILSKQLNEKEDEISSLRMVLKEREEIILQLDNGLKERESILLDLTEEVSKKEKKIIYLNEILIEKERETNLLREGLEGRENKINSLDKQLKENEKIISFMNSEVIEEGKTIFTLSRDLIAKKEMICDLSGQLLRKEKEITSLSNGLMILKKRLSTPLWGIITLFQHHFPRVWEFIYRKKNSVFSKNSPEKKKRSIKIFEPRLGKLLQHEPKEIFISEKYFKKSQISRIPKLSIVTPSFNQAIFLERTIMSVLGQDYSNLEYIIHDGGSNDESLNIIEKYKKNLSHAVSEKDNGQADAINKGFKRSNGELMAWINSDDCYLPGAFNYVVNYFQKNPDVDVVYGHRILIDENDKEIGRWILPNHDKKVLYYADFIPQETLFWRREIWERTGGGLDEGFNFALDWDLLLRFQESGAKIVRLPRFLASFRVHPQQKTSAQISSLGEIEMSQIRRKYLKREVDYNKVKKNIFYYLVRSEILNKLYDMKIISY